MTTLSVFQEIRQGAADFTIGAYEIVSTTDGLQRLGAFVQSIFETIGKFFQSIPDAITTLDIAFGGFSDLTNLYNVFKRLRSFLVPDEITGKFLWQTAWQNIVSTLAYTVANITKLLTYLKTLKISNLGNSAAYIAITGVIANTVANIFDTWHTINGIIRSALYKRKAVRVKKEWTRFHRLLSPENLETTPQHLESWSKHVDEKIQKYNARLQDLNLFYADPSERFKITRIEKKKLQWEALNRCNDPQAIRTFCGGKVRKWDLIKKNCQNDLVKSWILIAINIGNLLVTALGYLLPGLIAFQIGLTLFTTAVNGLDLSSIVVDKFLPTLPIIEPSL